MAVKKSGYKLNYMCRDEERKILWVSMWVICFLNANATENMYGSNNSKQHGTNMAETSIGKLRHLTN